MVLFCLHDLGVPEARDLDPSADEAGNYANPYPADYPITNKKTQGPPRQCSMRWWSGVNPWSTPHSTA